MQDSRHPGIRRLSSTIPVTRRALMRLAAALGIGGVAAQPQPGVGAQVPSPAGATPEPGWTRSITRTEYLADLRRHFSLVPPANRGGHALMAISGDPGSLHPMLGSDFNTGLVQGALFNALVQPSLIDGSWVPDLAEFWETSPDSTTVVFHLSPQATWHDGQPVTAHDCVFTLDSVLDEGSLSPIRSDVVRVVEAYRAIDDHTFELTAQQPVATLFDKSVGGLAIVPKHVWESIPLDEWGTAPGATGVDPSQVVGSGPFRLGEWALGEHVTIVRNDDYWIPELVPALDAFSWRVLPEDSAASQALIAGDIDISGILPWQVATFQALHPTLSLYTHDELGWLNYTLNGDPGRSPLFVDSRVRRAMLHALDRDLLIETMLDGRATRADGIYPPPSPVYAPERVSTIYHHDPDLARSLLDDPGWLAPNPAGVRERDGVDFRAELLYVQASELSRQIATYLQQAWREVGLDIQPRAVAWPELQECQFSGDFALMLNGWGGFKDDQGVLYRCDAVPPDGLNFQRICNPEFDRLHDASVFELDPARRRELLIEQGNIVNDEAHLGLLFFRTSTYATQPRVRNFVPSPYTATWPLAWIWLDETG